MIPFDLYDDISDTEFASKSRGKQIECGKVLGDGNVFNYKGNPNLANKKLCSDQNVLYKADQGSIFLQECGAWWYKVCLPNKWIKMSEGIDNYYNTVVKRLAPNDSEVFFSFNVKLYEHFRWSIELISNDVGVIYELSSIIRNEEIITTNCGEDEYDLCVDIKIYLEDDNIILEIENNESSTLLCTAKAITL